jgi:hypothetical protein
MAGRSVRNDARRDDGMEYLSRLGGPGRDDPDPVNCYLTVNPASTGRVTPVM